MTEQLESGSGPTQTATTDEASGRPRSLSSVMTQLAHVLTDTLSSGDVADLRRLAPSDAGSPAFWKIVALVLEPAGQLPEGGPTRDAAERRWAAILQGLANLGHLHQHGLGLGRALAEASFAELRFVRLLRSHDSGLLDLVRTTARFLAAKGQAVDWTDMAWLVLSDGRKHEEKVRRRLARDYYRHLS